jgi:hypothetical protein
VDILVIFRYMEFFFFSFLFLFLNAVLSKGGAGAGRVVETPGARKMHRNRILEVAIFFFAQRASPLPFSRLSTTLFPGLFPDRDRDPDCHRKSRFPAGRNSALP